jgi:hypothetical protein
MPTRRPISIQEEESQRRVAMVFNLVGAAHRAGLTKLSIHRAVDLVSRVTLKAGARDALLAIAREKPATWRGGDDEGRKRDRDALHRAVLRARKSAGGKPLQRGRKKKNARSCIVGLLRTPWRISSSVTLRPPTCSNPARCRLWT